MQQNIWNSSKIDAENYDDSVWLFLGYNLAGKKSWIGSNVWDILHFVDV